LAIPTRSAKISPAGSLFLCGEIAKLWLCAAGCLKIESAGWAKAHLRRATKIVQNWIGGLAE
jgi:hypothetical protein